MRKGKAEMTFSETIINVDEIQLQLTIYSKVQRFCKYHGTQNMFHALQTFVNQCKNDSRSSVELKIKIGRVFCMPYTANIFCSCWFNFLANLYSCQVLVLYLSAVFQKNIVSLAVACWWWSEVPGSLILEPKQ